MIARVIRGRGFGGTVRYCAEKAVGDRPLGSSVLSEDPNGPSEREVIYHLRSVTSAREAARPVVHIPIRTRDDEHLSEEQWLAVAERVRIEMGFENCPWAAYLHNNEDRREGQHLHLVVSRVSFDGEIVSDRNDRFRVMEIMRVLELEHGLEPVLSGERSRSRAYPHNEEGRAKDRELIMLRAQIDAAGANARTLRGFVERLEAAGVRAHLKISSNGHLQGASFQLAGSERFWKGSDLGRAYSIGRLVERFGLAQEGELLRAYEVRPRELQQLRSVGLEPDRVEGTSNGRLTVAWALAGNPREQDLYQQWVQTALPGRLCERSGGGDAAWSREVPASVLEARRQQIEAGLAGRGPAMPAAVPLLSEGPQGLREAGRQVEALLERYARDLRAGESRERLSATWLEILRWTGVRGVRPEALEKRGLGQQLAGLGSIAQTQNAVRSRLLRGERGYVSLPVVRGELTHFPPHLLQTSRGPEHREFNRRANQIVGERESVALLRLADHLGRSREDRRLRDRLEKRLAEVERAAVSWGAKRSGRAVRPLEKTMNAEAARRSVSRTLGGRLRQAERGLSHGLMSTVTSLVPRPRLPGLGLLEKATAKTSQIGQGVLVIEAAVRSEHGRLFRQGANPLEQVASGDVSTYRLLRLTSGDPKAAALFEAPQGQARDLSKAIREYRRSRAELIRLARRSLREEKPWREVAAPVAQRAAGLLIARERVVNAALAKLGIPSLRMLAGTARDRTEVLSRFAQGCRLAGMSVGTVARVVDEIGPVVLGVTQAAGWAREIGQAVLVIEAAVRREHRRVSRRGANHLEQVASGDVSTYRLLRLTSGHPKAVALFEAPQGQGKDLSSAVREYRRSRAELIRLARTSLREGRPWREVAALAAQRAAGVLTARERVVNAALHKLGIPSLRMLAGTARDRTEVLSRFAQGCRSAGMSVGTVARVVAEVAPVVLGGVLAGAAVTLASRLVMRQVFGLGRDLAKEFLYGERERGR